jgi:hypothetical protein
MSQPLATWTDDNSRHPLLVWWSRLDDRWQIEVQRTGPYTGNFCIFDHANGDKEILCEPTSFMYDAAYGPDVEDVAKWEDRGVQFIDHEYRPNVVSDERQDEIAKEIEEKLGKDDKPQNDY